MAGTGEDEEAQGLVQAFTPEQPRVGHASYPEGSRLGVHRA